jgi:hypothetical protein
VWIATGATAVTLATAIGFGIDALSKSASYKANPNGELARSGESSATAADVLFGATAVVGTTALLLYFFGDEPEQGARSAATTTRLRGSQDAAMTSTASPSRPRASWAPVPMRDGGGLVGVIQF